MDDLRSAAADLPVGVWAPFAEGLTPREYAPDQLVYLQGSEADRFYYIQSGTVKSFLSSDGGGERILAVYRTGDLMGEASFFDELPRVSSASALTRCRIVGIDRERVRKVFSSHPELALALLKYLARTVRLLSGHVDGMTFLSADRRLARLLLTLSPERDGAIHMTHEALGNLAGASRVTVNRILNRFCGQGWVELGYGTVKLKHRDAMRSFAEQDA